MNSRHATTALTWYLVALFLIPSRLIFAPLGESGTPAQCLTLALGVLWVGSRLASLRAPRPPADPTRRFMLVFVAAILASYIAAGIRPIAGVEQRSADAGVLMVLGWLGLLLFTSENITTMRDLQTLMRRAVAMAGAVATLGLAQFVTGMLFINYVQLPGLTTNVPLFAVSDRGGLNRPPGTAIHPIEFGSLLTMILPIALHLAMTDRSRTLLRRWYPVGVIAVAIPIAISRSAILSALVVLVVLLPTWSTRVRRRAYLIIIALVGALFVTIPGLIGTITRLFTGISGDSSAQSRTDSYHIAFEFISRNPIVGRGFMTFLPAYRILDNQYLGLLIDAGILGLTSYLLLLASGIYTAVRIRRNSSNADIRGIAQAFAASIASAAASFALFDAFSFPMAGGTLMFVMGLTGALARITWMNRDTVTVRYGNGARKRRVAP